MIEGTFRKGKSTFAWTLVVSGAVVVGGALAVILLINDNLPLAMVVSAVAILVSAVAIRQVRQHLILVRFDGQQLTIGTGTQSQTLSVPFDYGIASITTSKHTPNTFALTLVAGKTTLQEPIPSSIRPPNLPAIHTRTEIIYSSTTPFPSTLWEIIRQFDLHPNPLVSQLIDADDALKEAVAQYDYASAIRLLSRKIQRGASAQVYYNRGLLQDDKRAVDDFSKAISQDNRFYEAYKARAMAQSRLKRWREVLADCETALAIRQDDALYNVQGVAFFALGEFDRAITSYDRAIAHNPRNAQAYNNRGVVRQRNGNPDGAKADYEQALQLDPDLTTAREGLAGLNG